MRRINMKCNQTEVSMNVISVRKDFSLMCYQCTCMLIPWLLKLPKDPGKGTFVAVSAQHVERF